MSQLMAVCLILPVLQMPDAAEMDKKMLQGDWKYYTGKITWDPKWGKNVFNINFAFKDDQGSFQFDKLHQTGKIQLAPDKTPKRMTITLNVKGKGAKSVIRAIYKFEGSRLVMCWNPKQPGYPPNFDRETYLKPGATLIQFKRKTK